ncbi:MAG TPA: uroporphyrinogen decarboxylase family protein, partial [Clostridia bacterium]
HKLLQHVNNCTIEFIKEVSKLGVSIGIGDPTASGSLISPRQFREFAYPYLKELTDVITEYGAPAPQLHICGNTKKIWHLMADTGAGALSLDDVIDIEDAKKEVGDRIVLVGNVRPTMTMYLGTSEDVVENVKENLRKAYDSKKGYILSLGCGLPIKTKPENVHAFIDAARKYGRYPLNPENFN